MSKFQLATKSEPEKSFIKAGILSMDGSFTPDGRAIFLQYLLGKNGDAFKTDVVDGIRADDEKEAS